MKTSTTNQSPTLETLPQPGPDNQKLEAFVGRWLIEGRNGESAPFGPGHDVQGEESYEWLPGKFFLVYNWSRTFAGNIHKGTGIFGFHEAQQKYFANFYDNLGFHRNYEVEIREGMLILSGDHERATIAVIQENQVIDIYWEQTIDGTNWSPLCYLQGTRIKIH